MFATVGGCVHHYFRQLDESEVLWLSLQQWALVKAINLGSANIMTQSIEQGAPDATVRPNDMLSVAILQFLLIEIATTTSQVV